jgi:hypothetical protein
MSKICIWYEIGKSTSPEGMRFQEQHNEINFNYCRKRCDGYKSNCDFYSLVELNEQREEDLVGRIEDLDNQLNMSNEDYIRYRGSYATQ